MAATVPLCDNELFISGSCPILGLTTFLGRPRGTDAKIVGTYACAAVVQEARGADKVQCTRERIRVTREAKARGPAAGEIL